MIPLIRYGESPKNPTPVQKPVEANSIAAGRPATEDISFTGQKLPLSCHSLLHLLRLSYSPGPVTAVQRPRQEFELIFGADVQNYRQSCRPLVHAARPSVCRVVVAAAAAAAAVAAVAAVVAARRDAPRQETNERRSSCPLGAQWKRRPETIVVAVTASWILDNWPLLYSCTCMRAHPI